MVPWLTRFESANRPASKLTFSAQRRRIRETARLELAPWSGSQVYYKFEEMAIIIEHTAMLVNLELSRNASRARAKTIRFEAIISFLN
jgi:hypothetical protein